MKDKTKTLLSNTFYFAIAGLGAKLMVFLMVPVYTHILSAGEYGIVSIIQTTNSFLYPILTLYISNAVLRFCFIKTNRTEDVFMIGMRVCIVASLLNIPIVWIMARFSLFENVSEYMYLMPIMFTTHVFNNLFNDFSRCIDKVRLSALNGILNTFIIIACSILFMVIMQMGVIGYLLSFIIADSISVAFMMYFCQIKKYFTKKYNRPLAQEMYKYSLPLVPNRLSWWIFTSMNQYLILYILGEQFVGIYSASMRIPTILTVLCGIFTQAWLLSALEDYGSDENKIFIKSIHVKFVSIVTSLTSFLILFSYPLSQLLLSGEFSSSWRIIPFMFIAVCLGSLVGFYESVFLAEKKNLILLVATFIGTLVSTFAVITLLKYYKLIVVSLSLMVGYIIICSILKLKIKKFISDIGLSNRRYSLYITLMIVEAFCVAMNYYFCAVLCFFALGLINRRGLSTIARNVISELVIYKEKLKND